MSGSPPRRQRTLSQAIPCGPCRCAWVSGMGVLPGPPHEETAGWADHCLADALWIGEGLITVPLLPPPHSVSVPELPPCCLATPGNLLPAPLPGFYYPSACPAVASPAATPSRVVRPWASGPQDVLRA
jgi:hypothetical protein